MNYLNKVKRSFIVNCGYGKGYSVKQIVNIFRKNKKNLITIMAYLDILMWLERVTLEKLDKLKNLMVN